MHTNRNAIVYGLSAGSGLPGHIRFSRSEYRYSMLWFSLVIGFLQKKCAENLEVMKFFVLSLSLSLSDTARQDTDYSLIFKELRERFFAGFHTFPGLFRFFVVCYHCHRLFLRRVRYIILSGGMRSMAMPCPYAAGAVCVYTDHRKSKTINIGINIA